MRGRSALLVRVHLFSTPGIDLQIGLFNLSGGAPLYTVTDIHSLYLYSFFAVLAKRFVLSVVIEKIVL